jgi:lipopolysaccharide export system protein LptA
MRRTRRLFLLAVFAILCGVGGSYYLRQQLELARPRVVPKSLRPKVQASGQDWIYRKEDGGIPIVEIRARDMEREEGEGARILLKGVELRLFHKSGAEFDLVKSASAEFGEAEGALYSDGEVEITLGVPADGGPKGRLLSIRSSRVRFDAASGRATTDAPASFVFDLGDGEAVGAAYDPATRELELNSQIVLRWRGRSPQTKPMVIEAGRLLYRERESKVFLSPWARLRRDQLTLDGEETEVTLEQGSIRMVTARNAQGSDEDPSRRLKFGASELRLDLTEKSEIEKITGTGKARLEAQTEGGLTTARADQVAMDFQIRDKNSILTRTVVNGSSVLESKPAPRPGQPPRSQRILRSETVEMIMRADGEEIETVQTHSPGSIDLVPGRPSDPRRHMTAERMWMNYGAKNQLKSFRAVQVATRTLKPAQKGKSEPPPALTWSKDMTAAFDEDSGEVTRIEQWNNFRYREGDQEATAAKATLEQAGNLIHLEGSARAWDKTGSVQADKIVMHQETGDFTADGSVTSSRMPDRKASSGGMLAQDEPVQATAARMVSTERNRKVVYEGGAMLWQSSNRLQAQRVEIDRGQQRLHAAGGVVSQFLDKKPDAKKKAEPVLTIVRAATLDYSDKDKLALYKGGVRLVRDGMDVKSSQLRAYLKENKEGSDDSSLDRAFADGAVEIFQAQPGRTRRGSAEHAEYYVADERVVLRGGHPQMIDSVKGATRGKQLTYWANNDSLQVDGAETQPAVSVLHRN